MEHKTKSYPLLKLRPLDSNKIGLFMSLELVEASLFLDKLSQEERKQLLMILRLCEVPSEALQTQSVYREPELKLIHNALAAKSS